MIINQTTQSVLPTQIFENLKIYHEEIRKKEALKQLQEKIERLLDLIPPRFKNIDFDDFKVDCPEQERIKRICWNFVETFNARLEEGTNLVFLGEPGTGKTMLSFIILQALLKKNFSVKYFLSLSFLAELQDKRLKRPDLFKEEIKRFREIKFLVIDESTRGCGKGGALSGWESEILFLILNERDQYKLSTLLISNNTKNEFNEKLGKATIDRLSRGVSLAFNWGSYRSKSF